MALNPSPAPSSGIWQAIQGALGIFDGLNKANYLQEEATPTPMEEYISSLTDSQIIQLQRSWRDRYTPYYAPIEKSQKVSFEYWIGKQDSGDGGQLQGSAPATDNKIFEAIETFLPIATRANPDPVVSADPSAEGQKLSKNLKNGLVYEADRQKLRMVLKKATRHWMLNRLGVVKFCWNPITQRIETHVINPRKIILDPHGQVGLDCKFNGEYIGEIKKESASKLIEKFPDKAGFITARAQNKLGTELQYYEWWYRGTDFFFTMEEEVLGKFKNPHWNYSGEQKVQDPETGEELVDEIKGENHLDEPESPYRFLTVFNTGMQPHDDTGLVMQNVGVQDMINRRWRQIEKNVERINNGLVVNGRSFTDEQASLAATAMRRGTAIRVPNPVGNNLQSDIMNFPAPNLPDAIFANLQDARNELANIFGVSGSQPQGIKNTEDVRGKILINQLDASRIGGGVTEYIEQLADSIYNYWVQMMYVYFDVPHYMTVSGLNGGKELAMLHNSQFGLSQTLDITVKEGSLIPKDPLTKRNEAVDLWSQGALDPRSLFTALDFPDPNEATRQLILWKRIEGGDMSALQMYMPDFQQTPGMQAQSNMPQTGVGDEDQNAPTGGESPEPQPLGAPEGVQAQSQQIMSSVPIQ